MSDRVTICICGAGNGAHVIAGLAAAHARMETRVLTLYQNEADVWTERMKGGDLVIARRSPDGTIEEVCQHNHNLSILLQFDQIRDLFANQLRQGSINAFILLNHRLTVKKTNNNNNKKLRADRSQTHSD